MKYCPNCGTPLVEPNPKFCSECGGKLNVEQISSKVVTLPMPSMSEEDIGPVKLNTYNLGVALENTTASILEKMGYSVEKRKRLPTKSGATAEIDLLLTRGNRRRLVECKNYDPSRSVPVSDMRIFKDKVTDTAFFQVYL
ncbi:MAG: zinc ribbon domain-containing protein [Candidatus Bathyarchaeota archaeon]|nr:zinc ribbon domain-containing protein [Candidatus Bathyarchaeota archaeon]